jgi:hypothetical protein
MNNSDILIINDGDYLIIMDYHGIYIPRFTNILYLFPVYPHYIAYHISINGNIEYTIMYYH